MTFSAPDTHQPLEEPVRGGARPDLGTIPDTSSGTDRPREKERRQTRRSLKRLLQALSILVCITLTSGAYLGLAIFQSTESARITEAQAQLNLALERITRQYENGSQSLSSVRSSNTPLLHDSDALRKITLKSLEDLSGLEGGFFTAENGSLLGYAYPTYAGSGPKTDIPEAERPAITNLAEQAITTNLRVHQQVERGFDIVLFGATPLMSEERPVGSAWAMYRLPGIRNPKWRYYSRGLAAMLGMAGLVAGGAWLIARRLDKTISHVVNGIRRLNESAIPPTGYTELDRVVTAINHLLATVHAEQAQRGQLERQLHLADRLAILGRLVAGVAHEVRNPLSSIRLKLQLARRGPIEIDRLVGTFDVVEQEITRLDRLVARLLSIAKPASHSLAPTDVVEFVETRLQHWLPRASELRITVNVHPMDTAGSMLWLDQDRLGQILDNLLANAFDALAGSGGSIRIAFRRLDQDLFGIAITDSGPGLSPEAHAHLFEPFFTTRSQGTGLGLFLSAELARALGGTLVYVDSPGSGASFELRIPYRLVDAHAPSPAESAGSDKEEIHEITFQV